jgi:hypothetical protein
LSIEPVEGVWLLASVIGFVFTFAFLADALRLRHIGNGARVLLARGDIRRAGLALVVQALLVSVIIPGLFVKREIPLSPPVIALIAVPIVLALSAFLDFLDRRRIIRLVRGEA